MHDDKNADKAGGNALMRAALQDTAEVITALCDSGATLNTRDANGRTALLLAAAAGQGAAVQSLLQQGASADITDNAGISPLMWARQNGHAEIGQLLETRN